MADALDFLFVDQFGHALLERLFIHLVGKLIDNDGLSLALVDILEMAFGAHNDTAASRTVAVLHAIDAVNDSASGKVWRRNDFHQFINGRFRMFQQMQAGIDHFIQVVRGDVGCHAHGDPAGAVDQQVGQAGRHDQRFLFAAIVIWAEINRFLVQIC